MQPITMQLHLIQPNTLQLQQMQPITMHHDNWTGLYYQNNVRTNHKMYLDYPATYIMLIELNSTSRTELEPKHNYNYT